MSSPRAIINLENLRSNIDYIKKITKNAELYPVIKADGYGHGAVNIALSLLDSGIKTVCVATHEEIIELISADIDLSVLHLGKIFYNDFKIYFNKNVILTINCYEDVEKVKFYTKKYQQTIRCHIKIDTGLNRMGCKASEFKLIYSEICKIKLILLEGVYSHLSSSPDFNATSNCLQFNCFKKAIDFIQDSNIKLHFLNSGGILNFKNNIYDAVRPGIIIYGISPIKNNKNLKPVMELKAPVVLIKNIFKGESIGYDSAYTASKNMTIAIVQCGYADGLNKNFEKKGVVFYKNKEFEILGKISMDLFAVNCSNYKLKINDELTIWGGENYKSKLEHISSIHKSIPYIYLTSLSRRVKREYIEK